MVLIKNISIVFNMTLLIFKLFVRLPGSELQAIAVDPVFSQIFTYGKQAGF